jgi:hypothetical protein
MNAPPDFWIAVLIGSGTLLALVRLWLWHRGAPGVERGPTWRLPVLMGLNVVVAVLLYLTLDPPDIGVRSGRLVVLTADAAVPQPMTGDVVVALPEAPKDAGKRMPDLATALRRFPEVRSIQVLGAGLTARDRVVVDRPVSFDGPSPPVGFVSIALPRPVTPGARFAVSGSVGALANGTVELTDPSGAIVDQNPVTAGSRFILTGTARTAGLALFEVRLRDADGDLVERFDAPLHTREVTPPRVIVLAGAPGPEPRFLRRWAEETGIDLSVRLSLGAGVDLTAAPTSLNAQTLSDTDLLVLDERSWEALDGAERVAVRSAVSDGMGLLLRPTGPLSDATRRDWAGMSADLTGGENLRPLVLPETAAANAPEEVANEPAETVPELTRRDFSQGASEAAVFLRDADGTALATWRPYGEGRVGVWVVADSYALVLTGQNDLYGALWSRMFSGLARTEGQTSPWLDGIARAGERGQLCDVALGDTVIGPDGAETRLVPDPRAGPASCAAFWPRRSGWHGVTNAEEERGVVYVHPEESSPSLVAAELATATQALVGAAPQTRASGDQRRESGSPWPWLIGLLGALGAMWWLERRRLGLTSSTADPPLSQTGVKD